MFCNKPTPSYTTQNPDLFIAHKKGFIMHTGIAHIFSIIPKTRTFTINNCFFFNDLYSKDEDSDSTASTRVPRHSYNLRSQPRRNSQELQSLTGCSTNSRLVRQQAQPRSETPSLSSSHPTIPSSLSLPFQVTSGFESASLLSEDPQTISGSAANFSRVFSPSSIQFDSSTHNPKLF